MYQSKWWVNSDFTVKLDYVKILSYEFVTVWISCPHTFFENKMYNL